MEINHCQNLWEQFARVTSARENCKSSLREILGADFKSTIGDFRNRIISLELEIKLLESEWEKTFVTLPDGKALFKSEYETLKKVLELSGLTGPISWFLQSRVKVENSSIVLLSLHGTTTGDISLVTSFPNLAKLSFEKSSITDISILSDANVLEVLNLGETNVSDISALQNLPNLTELNIANTQVASIPEFSRPYNLTYLNLSRTPIKDITPLRNMANLATLDLSMTSINDISPLRQMTGLNEVYLEDTYAAEDAEQQEVIKTLKRRGVNVHV